jgi:hypothetical protein
VSRTWTCSRCGESHAGLPDIAFDAPLPWDGLDDEERDASDLQPDTCEIHSAEGDFFYVRGILEIPIRDFDQCLGYGVWSSLSAANFERFVELYDDPARIDEPAYTSWFGNRIPGFPDTFNLKAWVEIRDADLRPSIVLHEQDHPLVEAARDGIDLAQAIALVEPYLHA